MRARRFVALFLASTMFPLSAYADHVAACGDAVERLEAQLRGAIRASVNAGCDPFGGLMARVGCSERIEDIRDLAHQIEFVELTATAEGPDTCVEPLHASGNDDSLIRGALAASPPSEEIRAASPDVHVATKTEHATRIASPATAGPIPPERQSVRSVGPDFLPEDDGRFEAIAKGSADLPDNAANALVSWIGIGKAAPDRGDRLAPDAAITTASVE